MADQALKEQLLRHLKGGEAFMPVSELLEKISFKKSGKRPVGLPYSFYEIFYHMVYAQKDILSYCTAEDYKLPAWPRDYWPDASSAVSKESWEALKNQFKEDQKQLAVFVETVDTHLLDVVKHGKEQTVLRELMLVIEHNAYHAGQLAIILRLLGLL